VVNLLQPIRHQEFKLRLRRLLSARANANIRCCRKVEPRSTAWNHRPKKGAAINIENLELVEDRRVSAVDFLRHRHLQFVQVPALLGDRFVADAYKQYADVTQRHGVGERDRRQEPTSLICVGLALFVACAVYEMTGGNLGGLVFDGNRQFRFRNIPVADRLLRKIYRRKLV